MATLAQLRTRAQQESDNLNSAFISTSEWTSYLNASYSELYGLIVQAYGNDYYVATPYTFVTDGTNQLFDLPDDFWKLLGADLQVNTSNLWVTLRPFTFQDRNRFGLINSPVPMAGQTIRLWYVPTLTALSGDSDETVTICNGQDEYIVIDSALKALAKEESEVSVLMARKQQMIERINAEAQNRDAGSPTHIVDVYNAMSPAMQYHLLGGQIQLIGGNTPVFPYGQGYAGEFPWGVVMTTINQFLKLRGEGQPARAQDNINAVLGPIATALNQTPIVGAPAPAWIQISLTHSASIDWARVSGQAVPAFHKDALTYAHIKGSVSTAAGQAAGTLLFVLPAGYRPAEPLRLSVRGNAGAAQCVTIDASGNVKNDLIIAAGGTIDLNVTFRAEQ